MFALTLVVLLLASINYQLNLGYVLTFLLAGSGVVSMHITHGTLRGLTLHLRPVAPAFAGGTAVLDVVMSSPARRATASACACSTRQRRRCAWTNVPAGGQARRTSASCRATRGLHDVPTLSAETRFPLGLFRAWTVWRPAARLLVYPAAEADAPPLPAARRSPAARRRRGAAQGGEIEGVRAYRRGDPLKLVAWKKAAQALETGAELVSRDTSTSARQELWLDWAACGRPRPRAAPVAPRRVDARGRPRRRRLRPAPARRRDRARRRRCAARALPRGARAVAPGTQASRARRRSPTARVAPHWPGWRQLPRDAATRCSCSP